MYYLYDRVHDETLESRLECVGSRPARFGACFFIQFPAVIPDDFANLGGLAQCLSHMEL